MKQAILVFTGLFIFILWRCNQPAQDDQSVSFKAQSINASDSNKTNSNYFEWKKYTSNEYHFALRYPSNWKVEEGHNNSAAPVINIYNSNYEITANLPFEMEDDPSRTYFALCPKGSAKQKPVGSRISLQEWNKDLVTDFNIDEVNSLVFMLNDGKAWGYYIKPLFLPRGWSKEGFLYIQIGISNFKAKCFDKNGKEKSLKDCDTFGSDKLSRYGNISNEHSQLIHAMLSSLYFYGKGEHRKEITDLISIESPSPNEEIKSPLIVKGKARGYWFFEGSFPVQLKNSNHKIIVEKPAQAKGRWMTQKWVSFEATVEFNASSERQGYLVFKKANASGKAENDRSYMIPVTLPVFE